MKYEDSESAKEIPTFFEFHRLNVDELLDPLDSFSEFSPLLYLTLISVSHKMETSSIGSYSIPSISDIYAF